MSFTPPILYSVFHFALALAEYTRIKSARFSQPPVNGASNDTISLNEETTIWLEVVGGKNKKGHVFGLGSMAYKIGSYPLFQEEIDKRAEQKTKVLEVANASLKQTVDEQKELIVGYKDKFAEYDRLFSQLFSKFQGNQGTPSDNS
ncbi:uncharacterized protein G2W53_041868 [Senna tora]|uniref:Uncharacterized protein n=1 Tax=Senna tora TaxID=362788 RepID=A0A834SKM8_9FABA|nr:uncharacterized protein G2W53_041868 [Senna tora]